MSTDPSHGSSAENPDSTASPDSTGSARDAQAGAPSDASAERSADGQAGSSSSPGGSQAAPHGGSQPSSQTSPQGGSQSQGWNQAAQQPQWGQQAQPGQDERYAQGSANGQQPPYGQAPQYGQRDQASSTGQAPQYGQGTYDAQVPRYGQQPGTGQAYSQNGPYAQADQSNQYTQNGQQAQGHQYPQQYQQGGPSYAPGGYGAAPKPKSGMKKTGAVFAIVGGIILVLSLVGGFLLLGSSVSEAMEQQEQGTEIHGSGSVQLESGKTYAAYRKENAPAPTCEISGPASVRITTDGIEDGHEYPGDDGQSWVAFNFIEGSESGLYHVRCDSDDDVLIARPLDVGPALNAAFGMVILLGGGSLGFILLVLGIILFFVGRSRQQAMIQQSW